MSEPSSDLPSPPVYAQSWLVRFGFALVAALTLIVGLAFFDNSRRRELETVAETTAVGDTQFFQIPTEAIEVSFEGRPIAVKRFEPFELRDTHTRRAGRAADAGVMVYELAPTATDEERERVGRGRRVYLLKTGINRYLAAESADGN
jgi:hypothetical protein